MFKKAFLTAAAERALSTAAQAVVAVVGTDVVFDAINADWQSLLGIGAGGFVLSVLKAIAAGAVSSGPSFTPKAEVDSALAPLTEV